MPPKLPREFDAKEIILQNARKYQVDPALIAALIMQESGADTYAVRFEPAFKTRYLDGKSQRRLGGYWPRTISKETEMILRATSIGAMQVMGQTAREHGLESESLLELVRPEVGIEMGVKVLSSFITKFGDREKALLAYNGGSNRHYAAMVLERLGRGDGEFLLMR